MTKNNHTAYVMRDLGIVALSVIIAVLIAKTGILKDMLTATRNLEFFGSFLSGMFFTSVFTTVPTTIVLGQLAQTHSVLGVAFFGGIGALLGDMIMFRFVKDELAEDLLGLIDKSKQEKFAAFFRLRLFRRLMPVLGALVIASPLPDELGLAMMGLSKMPMKFFVPISFTFNFLGIVMVGLVARSLV